MELNSNKLETIFLPPATESSPVNGRRYTLTHSDDTGMMFLDIGITYNYSAINQELRDEVLGKWVFMGDNSYILFFYVFVGDSDYEAASKRYDIFKSHLISAIQNIIYGDRYLLEKYTELVNTPIYVKFDSSFPTFDNYEYYGYVSDYML